MNLQEIKTLKQKILDCDQIITSQILGFLSNPSPIQDRGLSPSKLESIQSTNLNQSQNFCTLNSLRHISTNNLIRFREFD
jgi:hypothetical protein